MNFQNDSTSAWMAQACLGHKEAFNSLFLQHQAGFRKILVKHLGGTIEVEYLLQNVAYKAFTHLSEF